MNINKFNSEGYVDQTAFEAISNIVQEEKKVLCGRRQVYICSPYAGDTERNIANALRFCRFAIDRGYDPIAPHVYYTRFLDDGNPTDRELGLYLGLRHLKHCKEMWVFGSRISAGMAIEIGKAKQYKIPVCYFTEQCEEVRTT